MTVDDGIIARKLLIEQTRREILDQLKGYRVGWCHDGEMFATKNSSNWNGYLLVIPDDEWVKWFGGGNE